MNNIFTKNLPWKITSLVLATILWLFVINTQNPMQPQEIRSIPVTIKGISQLAEKGFVLKNEEQIKKQRFSVRVNGPRLQTDKILADSSLINVTLDLTQYMNDLTADSVQVIAKYKIAVNIDGVSVLNSRPEIEKIILEKEKAVTKDIEYKIVGNTDNEYTALSPIISPSTVEVSGAKSDIEQIDKAIVEINIENFSEDELVQTVPVKICDGEGKEIKTLKKSPQLVEVKLPIGKKKTVPLEASFKGTLPKGYVHTNTIITPNQITIVGKAAAVDAIKKVQLKAISLDDVIQTSVIKTEMILPKGIQYIDNIDNVVNVTIEIKKENSYTYTIPTSQLQIETIGMQEGLGYEVLTDNIELELSATAEELLALKTSDIKAKIDLTTLTAGEYTIPIEFTVPENFVVINKPADINVRLVNINADNTNQTGQEAKPQTNSQTKPQEEKPVQ